MVLPTEQHLSDIKSAELRYHQARYFLERFSESCGSPANPRYGLPVADGPKTTLWTSAGLRSVLRLEWVGADDCPRSAGRLFVPLPHPGVIGGIL
jgi:hypothetical protein